MNNQVTWKKERPHPRTERDEHDNLAEELGISQQSVSALQKSETLEDEKLEVLLRF